MWDTAVLSIHPDGKWYMTVHSYENGYRTLGRQLLLLPVEWTADGWFRVKPEIAADSAIPMPVEGSGQEAFLDPSDRFSAPELGLQWGFWREYRSKALPNRERPAQALGAG